MAITSLIGFSLMGISALGTFVPTKPKRLRNLLVELLELSNVEIPTDSNAVLRPKVFRVIKTKYGYTTKIRLPKGYAIEKFLDKVPIIEQGLGYAIRTKRLQGREIEIQIGTTVLRDSMAYKPSMAKIGVPTIPYFTPFGLQHLNFWDETTCHIIGAGATRMGKSVLLRLMFTNIMIAMNGNVRFFYINNKIEDGKPFRNIPQITPPAETIEEAASLLGQVMGVIHARKELIRSTTDCVNAKQFREKHPEIDMPPIFVVFDEYGRFAEDEGFQEIVTELAETAGYLDVHLVIATQRPDATTVLKPRIRANILTRICFQTADERNSEIVVHTDAAAHLDSIRGRAIVLDGFPQLGHIPYISEDEVFELLADWRVPNDAQPKGQEYIALSESLPSFVTRPTSDSDMFEYGESLGDIQSNHKKTQPRRTRSRNSTSKR